MAKKIKLPSDINKRAKSIVDIATSESEGIKEIDPIKAAASSLGRKGGLKGGKARTKALTSNQRKEIGKKAAAARWSKK